MARNYKPRRYNKKKLNRKKFRERKYGRKQHVARIPKINLKPTSCARRVFWRNTIYITNTTTGPPMPWFQTFNLNSPWVINPSSNIAGTGTSGSLASNPNVVAVVHSNGQSIATGTAYPGLFDQLGGPGYSYRQMCVAGTKFSASFTPQFEQADVQPAGLAAVVLAGPNLDLSTSTFTASTINDIPYTRIRKILGSQASLASQGGLSNTKSAYLNVKYSPKKFNDIKDLKDASQMWANITRSGTSFVGDHPAEVDRLVLGICPLLNTPLSSKSLPSGLLEITMEAVVLLREPNGTLGSDRAPLVDASTGGLDM